MGVFKGFTSVKLKKPTRSIFDLSHEKRLSTRMGRLTPIFFTEALPNDTFKCNSEIMIRLAPMLAPIMHRVNVFVHFFFVPNRLLWKDWEAFITNGRLGTETPPVPPNINIQQLAAHANGYFLPGRLMDYLGFGNIPIADAAAWSGRVLDTMPVLAAYKVWLDWYRDRNYIVDEPFAEALPRPSGNETNYTWFYSVLDNCLSVDWEKDYFTSALPWTQRGQEVLMPLVGTGDVTYMDTSKVYLEDGNLPANSISFLGNSDPAGTLYANKTQAGANGNPARIENIDEVTLTASEVSINDFRRALAMQSWMERQAVAGSRINETIMAHFARRTSDARLQRAEYLGGGKVPIKISEVLTTAYSQDNEGETIPPANMSGRGISLGQNGFTYNCEEWGFIIGFMHVKPTTAYMQGSHRMYFSRRTFLDYPWPSFAHLGEQPVYDYELYTRTINIPTGNPTEYPVFGYQSRYSDWKYIPSSSHGDFKTNLDFWHLTRKFDDQPILGNAFVKVEDDLQDRIFAVSEVDTLWCYIYNDCTVKRSLPYWGTPQITG